MAKKKDDFSKLDDDNIDLNFDALDDQLDKDDYDDYDDSGDRIGGKRQPVIAKAKAAASEVMPHKIISGVGHKIIDEFSGLSSTYDATITTISDLDRLKSDTFRELAPSMNRLKQVGRLYTPKVKKLLPEKLYSKLENLLEDKRYQAQSEEDQRTAAISSQLQEVFSNQHDIQTERYIKDKTDDLIKSSIDSSRHEESISILSQVRNILKANQRFMTGTFTKYLMKSLELKYRHLFYAKDLVDQSRETIRLLDSKLDAIKQNTALPDMVKRQKSEEAVQAIKDRMYGSMAESVGSWSSNFRANIIKNLQTKVLQKFTDTVNQVVSTGADSLEMFEDMDRTNKDMGIASGGIMAPIVGSLLRKVLSDTGAVGVRAGVGKQNIEDISNLISNFKNQLPVRIAEYAENKEGSIGDFLRLIVPNRERERGKLENVLEKGTEEVPFDVITRRSIIEIIPGFLSKIHQQSSILSETLSIYVQDKISAKKKDLIKSISDKEELVFDRELEDFISVSEFKGRAVDRIFGTQTKRTKDIENIVSTMYASYSRKSDDTEKFEQYLPEIIKVITNLSKHNDIVKPKLMLAYLNGDSIDSDADIAYLDYIFKDIPEEMHSEVASILSTTFFKDTSEGTIDRDTEIDVSTLLRAYAIEKDKHLAELSKFNAYGDKRYIKDLTKSRTDKELAPDIIKLRQQFEEKYGKKFTDDPIKVNEFNDKVNDLRKMSGIDHAKIRQIQGDVDIDVIKANMRKNAPDIISKYDDRDKSRDVDMSYEGILKRAKEAVMGDIDAKIKPIKDFYGSITDRIPTAEELKTIDAINDLKLGKFPGPKDKDEINALSDDTGIPNRDAVQVSGPGLYYQGVKKELHIPLDNINYDAKELIESVTAKLNEALDKGSSVVDKGKLKLGDVLKTQLKVTENIAKLTEVINTKSTKLINSFGKFTETMGKQITDMGGQIKSTFNRFWNTNNRVVNARMKAYELSDQAKAFWNEDERILAAKTKATELRDQVKSKITNFREDPSAKLNETLDTVRKSVPYKLLANQVGSIKINPNDTDNTTGSMMGNIFQHGSNLLGNVKNRLTKKPDYLQHIQKAVINIESMLAKHFQMTEEIESTKLFVSNQMLAATSRAEVMSSGNPQSISRLPLLSRLISFPFKVAGSAIKLGGKGIVGYYKGLADITKVTVPAIAKAARSIITSGTGTIIDVGKKAIPAIGETGASLTKSGIGILDKLGRTAGGGIRDLISTLASKTMGVYDKIQPKYVDVYRKNEATIGNPLLKGKDIEAGKYYFNDGSVVPDSYSIKQPVLNEQLQVLVSEDDIAHGLVNVENKELVRLSMSQITNPIIATGIAAGKFAGGLMKGYGSLLSTLAGGTIQVLKRIPLISRLFRDPDDKKEPGALGGVDKADILEHVSKHLISLDSSVKAIERTFVKPDIREGSYQDYLRDKNAADQERTSGVKPRRARDIAKGTGSGGAIMGSGILGSMFGNKDKSSIFDEEKEKEGGIGDTVKDVALGGSAGAGALGYIMNKFSKKGTETVVKEGVKKAAQKGTETVVKEGVKKAVQAGSKGFIRRGLASAGRFAIRHTLGTALRVGAAAVAGTVGAVPLLIGAGVAAAAGATYMTYKWAKGKNKRIMLTTIRNECYQVPEDKISDVIDLEDEVVDKTDSGKSMEQKDLFKYMKKFGLNPKLKDHVTFFSEWYGKSFLPILVKSAELFKSMGKFFPDQHKLENEQLDEYANQLKNSDVFNSIKNNLYIMSPDGFKQWNGGNPSKEEVAEETKPKSIFNRAAEFAKKTITKENAVTALKTIVNPVGAIRKMLSPTDTTGGASDTGGEIPIAPSHLPTEKRLDFYNKLFDKAAKTYKVDPALLKAMTKQESQGKADAVSHAGAQGLMQLMPATAADLGVKNAFDPEQNVMGGAKYISQLLKMYNGDTKLALAAYNAGMGNINKAIKVAGTSNAESVLSSLPQITKGRSKETQDYVKKISGYYAYYKGSSDKTESTSDQASVSAPTPIQPASLGSPIQQASYSPPTTPVLNQPTTTKEPSSLSTPTAQAGVPNNIKVDDSKQIVLLTEQNRLLAKLVEVLTNTDSKGITSANMDSKPIVSKLDDLINAVMGLNNPSAANKSNVRNVSFSGRNGIDISKQRLSPT